MTAMYRKSGFTLIELLIVIAIIAILALIAIPNFLEAQTRSKITKVMADSRTIAIGLEAYYVDWNAYPILRGYLNAGHTQWNRGGIMLAHDLTTPVAYLTNVRFLDPFNHSAYNAIGDLEDKPAFQYSATITYANILFYNNNQAKHWSQWLVVSFGPDYKKGPNPVTGAESLIGTYCTVETDGTDADPTDSKFRTWRYDPSNGTISTGDILRWQTESR